MKTVAVASGNPVKIQAALHGLRRMFPAETFRGEGIEVPSGVSAQPMSDDETLRGALNRAQSVRRAVPGADFWVGLEAGCERVSGSLYLVAWSVVLSPNQVGRARTATVPLPLEAADLIGQGVELGAAMDRLFQRSDSKRNSGAVGILTHDVVDRAAYFEQAVVMALIPFVNPSLGFVK